MTNVCFPVCVTYELGLVQTKYLWTTLNYLTMSTETTV